MTIQILIQSKEQWFAWIDNNWPIIWWKFKMKEKLRKQLNES